MHVVYGSQVQALDLKKGKFCFLSPLLDPDVPNPRLFKPEIRHGGKGRGHCRLPVSTLLLPRPWERGKRESKNLTPPLTPCF